MKELTAANKSDETILIRNGSKETPLHIAAGQGDPMIFEEVLKGWMYEKVVSADNVSKLRDGRGMTPLYIAADGEMEEIAIMLVEKILSGCIGLKLVDEAEPIRGWTSLHLAASRGYERVLDLLLLYGANSRKKDK